MDMVATGSDQVEVQPVGAGNAAGDPNAVAEPTVIEVDDETLIKPRGIEKPVKYGEHVRGLQSEFTKARQQAAQLQRDLEVERRLRQQYEQERQSAAQRQQQQPKGDPYEALRQIPYISGDDAASIVHSIGQQFSVRDRITLAALQELKQLKEVVMGISSTNSESAFDTRMKQFLQQEGYPAEAFDTAKDVFLAYEGDDVWADFPSIFRRHWDALNKAFEAQRAAALARNRGNAFVPGRGGKGSPSKPMQMKGNEDPREVANMLWDAMHPSGT